MPIEFPEKTRFHLVEQLMEGVLHRINSGTQHIAANHEVHQEIKSCSRPLNQVLNYEVAPGRKEQKHGAQERKVQLLHLFLSSETGERRL